VFLLLFISCKVAYWHETLIAKATSLYFTRKLQNMFLQLQNMFRLINGCSRNLKIGLLKNLFCDVELNVIITLLVSSKGMLLSDLSNFFNDVRRTYLDLNFGI